MSIYGLAPHLGATSVALLPEATAQLTSPTPASPRRQGASSEGPAPTQRPRPALAACINQQARCLRVPLPAPVAAAARSQTPSPLFAFSAASAAICCPCYLPLPPTHPPAAASNALNPTNSAALLPTPAKYAPLAPSASCVPVASCSCPRPLPACPLPAAPTPYLPPLESLPLLLPTPPRPPLALLPTLLSLLHSVLPNAQTHLRTTHSI